ncbi:hypothetical protein [Ponticaulis sp.]|jgi:hypothetical protein|uniref:hypothetical protein n=2 Tax=Ponticaulis sp. TaxID=2020902 RepID=UPI000B6E0C0B|nr:hypothetical protein [Ponticaulis sp.]RPG18337.1 MAG: hypothetical protein CBC85_003660 [Hyphomonadaceae bacterium TMED125]HBH91031.1 hypothetical protein [Hyphomonadaceae bacterium]MAJ08030.1 hypothetical protein [Ponticaulis sp.]MBN02626.1 hypothetical protein [Ponticaulis sp.]HBJ94061.1 hypothetical protein [Hyphomonadaceae bacterium]|tara:strand:- start:38004 stop:38297 length:294 start_codon:yes stop_codon:yes gene_type:complete
MKHVKPIIAATCALTMAGCISTESYSRDQAYSACRSEGVTDMNECIRDRMAQYSEERMAAVEERQRRENECNQRRAEAGARGVPHDQVRCDGEVFTD